MPDVELGLPDWVPDISPQAAAPEDEATRVDSTGAAVDASPASSSSRHSVLGPLEQPSQVPLKETVSLPESSPETLSDFHGVFNVDDVDESTPLSNYAEASCTPLIVPQKPCGGRPVLD